MQARGRIAVNSLDGTRVPFAHRSAWILLAPVRSSSGLCPDRSWIPVRALPPFISADLGVCLSHGPFFPFSIQQSSAQRRLGCQAACGFVHSRCTGHHAGHSALIRRSVTESVFPHRGGLLRRAYRTHCSRLSRLVGIPACWGNGSGSSPKCAAAYLRVPLRTLAAAPTELRDEGICDMQWYTYRSMTRSWVR
jgi:hypothetical protein